MVQIVRNARLVQQGKAGVKRGNGLTRISGDVGIKIPGRRPQQLRRRAFPQRSEFVLVMFNGVEITESTPATVERHQQRKS